MMDQLIDWLLSGDVSIQYQTRKYLLGETAADLAPLRARIATEGWGKRFLDARQPNGHWCREFYQIKWQSSHYTLLDLRQLEIEPVAAIRETLAMILRDHQGADGSLFESREPRSGDVCVNGMFLNYASFFGADRSALERVTDFLLSTQLPDGGFNCNYHKPGTTHSSMHTTISVLEGLHQFQIHGAGVHAEAIASAAGRAEEFLLEHRLFRSSRTGEIIDRKWLMLSYPSRWKYDILRALVYFADSGHAPDERMADALEILQGKRRADGTWPVQARHSGEVHFDMEPTGQPSRWNTLRALRVLSCYPGLDNTRDRSEPLGSLQNRE